MQNTVDIALEIVDELMQNNKLSLICSKTACVLAYNK